MPMAESKALYLSATKMAIRIGASAQKVNLLLSEMGYQAQDLDAKPAPWVPTAKGRPLSRVVHGKDQKGKAYTMLTWHESIAEELAAFATPTREEFDAEKSLNEFSREELLALKKDLADRVTREEFEELKAQTRLLADQVAETKKRLDRLKEVTGFEF